MSKTTLEQQWVNSVADFATNSNWLFKNFRGYSGDPCAYHIHHIEGRKAKRKVNLISEKVGEFYILPVPIDLHDVHSNNPLNVTHAKKKFESVIGEQKELWRDMVNRMRNEGYLIPFNNDTMEAITNG